MHRDDLPASEFIGAAANETDLEKLLKEVSTSPTNAAASPLGRRFVSYDIIEGDYRSGRIFYFDVDIPGTAAFHIFSYAFTVAQELLKLSGESRYLLPEPRGYIRGWEVRRSLIKGNMVALCWAAWCAPPTESYAKLEPENYSLA